MAEAMPWRGQGEVESRPSRGRSEAEAKAELRLGETDSDVEARTVQARPHLREAESSWSNGQGHLVQQAGTAEPGGRDTKAAQQKH